MPAPAIQAEIKHKEIIWRDVNASRANKAFRVIAQIQQHT